MSYNENPMSLQDIEELYLNLKPEERLELKEILSIAGWFSWKHMEQKLLAEYWIKYGYLARKIQESRAK